MTYPQIIDYNDALQTPSQVFADDVLKQGRVETSNLGLPLARSGGFALTYRLDTAAGRFAVRCFHREVLEIEQRYAAISSALSTLKSPYFVGFEFQRAGILIRGSRYPIVKMDWVTGNTLGMLLDRQANQRDTLANLRSQFRTLAKFLDDAGLAHGDLQNENIIIDGGKLRLIDYDGMFVSGLQPGRGTEIGHKHFQHPKRGAEHFGAAMDRFSSIVIDTSLAALELEPNLYRRFGEGGTTIILKANDFADPANSAAFEALSRLPKVSEAARRLANLCQQSIDTVPTLEDFLSGRGGEHAVAGAQTCKPVAVGYIGAFDVVDASDYVGAVSQVGNRVELIGKIVSVRLGVGKRGRGKGRPYAFVNFGNWMGESVKLTIWSEGLENLQEKPSDKWISRWVSVTGLIEPPFEGAHYGKPYFSVGITVSDGTQIVRLSEMEARYRLDRSPNRSGVEARAKIGSTSSNRALLDQIKGGAAPIGRARATPTPPRSFRQTTAMPPVGSTTRTSNQGILDQLKNANGPKITSTQARSSQPSSLNRPTPSARQANFPWGWSIVIGAVVLWWFSRG